MAYNDPNAKGSGTGNESLYDKGYAVDFYDKRYSLGYMESWPEDKLSRVLQIVKEIELPEGGLVVDYGCGNGIFTDLLSRALPDYQVYGCDISSVAVESAGKQFPHCTFKTIEEISSMAGSFDLLFTHHVLEHVYDIDEVWPSMASLLKESSKMFHILPCGDPGSLEHKICDLRSDGIDEVNGRFGFEEPGHIRRLDTPGMESFASQNGFALEKGIYSDHYYGCVKWVTEYGPLVVFDVVRPSKGKNLSDKIELLSIALRMIPLSLASGTVNLYLDRHNISRTLASIFFLVAALPAKLFRGPATSWIQSKSNTEFAEKRLQRGGSEMYLIFSR